MNSRAKNRNQNWNIVHTTLGKDEQIFGVVPKCREDFEKNLSQLELLRSIFFPNAGRMDRTLIKLIKPTNT